MDDIETILYASPKRENDIDDREVVAYASPRRESENEIDEKIYKEPKLETAVEIEKQTAEREKKNIRSELEQDKVDIQVSRESDIKNVQDVFDVVKEEEPLNDENFLIDDNDFFDSEEISNTDKEFITDFINRTNFNAYAKKFVEDQMSQKWKLFILKKKKLRRMNKCRLTMTRRDKM